MNRPAAATPVDISVRQMGFSFPKDLPRYWASNDPFETHVFHALSLTFPAGEQEFVASVRAFADAITDPALKDDVRAFVGQEMQHSREHEAFNEWIASLGLPTQYVQDFITKRIAESNEDLRPIQRLAVTCAFEHFTAILANAILEDPEMIASFDERIRPLWIWHAIEEAEHKSVAFDVFDHVGGTYQVRAMAMLFVTLEFIRNQMHFHAELMRADGQLTNLRSWTRGLVKYWGPRGRFTKLLPAYLDYYRRDFHPWQHDNRALLAKWKRYVEDRAKRVVPQASKAALAA